MLAKTALKGKTATRVNHKTILISRSAPLKLEKDNTSTHRSPGGGGLLKKVLYGEAPSRGPTPYPFIYHFDRKGTLSYTFHCKKAPLLFNEKI